MIIFVELCGNKIFKVWYFLVVFNLDVEYHGRGVQVINDNVDGELCFVLNGNRQGHWEERVEGYRYLAAVRTVQGGFKLPAHLIYQNRVVSLLVVIPLFILLFFIIYRYSKGFIIIQLRFNTNSLMLLFGLVFRRSLFM